MARRLNGTVTHALPTLSPDAYATGLIPILQEIL